MPATVFWQDAGGDDIATLGMTFNTGSPAVPTDPTSVSCVVTDPTGTAVVHTFGGALPADITKISTGVYQLLVGSTITGMWSYAWIGTGTASDVQAGTWLVNAPSSLGQWYTSLEEVKDRLAITDTLSDFQILLAVQAAAKSIEGYTGRHFYQSTETRTYMPYTLYELPIDDLVSLTSFKVDTSGNGVFDQTWTNGTDFELSITVDTFNANVSGESRPYTFVRAINASGGGKFFPFVWPFSRLDRIQIIGVWGWPQVPFAIKQATMQVASEYFKLKDSPFGLAGTSEFGVVRVPKLNPYIQKLLTPYISPKRKVGV